MTDRKGQSRAARWLGSRIASLARPYLTQKGNDAAMSFFGGEAPLFDSVDTDRSVEDWEKLAVTSEWVMSDIRVIANICAQADLNIYKKEGEEEVAVVDHEFEQISRSPMQNMPEGTFLMSVDYIKKYTFTWLLLRGEAYWLRLYDEIGRLAGYLPLPSSRLEPIPDGKKYIGGFRYTPRHGQRPITFLPEQICFFRLPNPHDYHRGLSPIQYYQYALETDHLARKWGLDTFKKEATLRTVLALSENLAEPVYNSRKAELEEAIARQVRFLITQGKDLTMTTFSMSPKDLEYLGGRAFNRDIIDRAYSFPQGYWDKGANRATAEIHKAALIEAACWPLLQGMASDITSQMIVPLYGSEYVCRFDDIRIADRQMEIEEARQYWQVTGFNEARAERGREAYDGPFAETIGLLPVPLATDPRFVASIEGLTLATTSGFGSLAEGAEVRADLRRWKSIELRRLGEGHEPGSYDFESDWLPVAEIRDALKACTDSPYPKGAVLAIFDGTDWLKAKAVPVPGHAGEEVSHTCPICGGLTATSYKDHGSLLVCQACGCTYDTEVE